MTTVAEVRLWGRTIGAVSMNDRSPFASFEYDSAFVRSDIQIAPLMMPLSSSIYSFPELSLTSFHGLPGMLADSIPDKFGNALIDAWLSTRGRTPASFNAVERLCYTGTRGMGALEFLPSKGPQHEPEHALQVDALVQLASDILTHRSTLATSLDSDKNMALRDILRVGTSAGGARAKAVIAWNPVTKEIRSGQLPASEGFEYWLLKFDGVQNNADKEAADPIGYGSIEYAYYLMATAAGIDMMESQLLSESGLAHFMTKRFDRTSTGGKVHAQTLAALAHYDFNMAGAHSYEQVFLTMRRIGMSLQQVEQMFRRMLFNIVARNQDDHVKNISFLMDRGGTWRLAPAYDITYSYNPQGRWTSSHQMTMNGKRDNFTMEDVKACAKSAMLVRGREGAILDDVYRSVKRWQEFGEKAGVGTLWQRTIANEFRMNLTRHQ